MRAEKLKLKLFAEHAAELDAFVEVFHGWIRDEALDDELLIDVADYRHVHRGPGIVLIGHAGDYYWDQGDGRPGLTYSRKRQAPPEGERLRDGLQRLLAAAVRLEAATGVRFKTDELLLELVDRLNAPNDDATFSEVSRELSSVLTNLYRDETALSHASSDARAPLAIHARAASRPSPQELLARLV
ncbi:MAG: hypothetical protein KC776_15885 [Myxococcales bacterium]|nr:hypothetical protein [Myxococcales bacterium]MCB9583186.1 hypothetical protein [Polyangiaceae bacterium]